MQAGRRKGKIFRPRLYIYYMFNIGINSSALGIIVHYTIPPPGFTFPQMVKNSSRRHGDFGDPTLEKTCARKL